ncbi:hypothetical protein ACFV0T_42005 [Streptomyces sp. NPDC059582]|uniref:hypothetical protein n=1 Tax=Streptomyces sp. NPDC059582 TaxID=3346875 RepID=UPI0036B812D3
MLRALGAQGVVQWARVSAGPDPLDSLVRPPMIAWRYVNAEPGLGAGITSVVESFQGNVEWVVDLSGKNWVIMPRRLRDAFAAASEGDTGVLADLKKSDQEFCVRATADLGVLTGRIARIQRA